MTRLWLFVHLVGVAGFLLFHGISFAAMMSVRAVPAGDGRRERILWWCEASKRSISPMYLSIGILLVGGIGGGIAGEWFDGWWLWVSIVLLLGITAAMAGVVSPWMRTLREGCTRWADGSYTLSDDDLDVTLAGPQPMVAIATGGVGLLAILALMVFKPGA